MPVVKPYERVNDCKPQPQASVTARARPVCLAKAVEDVRQKVRRDSYACVFDHDARFVSGPFGPDLNAPARFREFDCVR